MPIYSPTGYLDITNATLRTSNIETSNIKIGSANLFITTGNVSDEVFQFTNATTGLVTTGNVEIGGSITAPDGVTDIKSNLIVEGNVEAAALRLNSVSISPVYTIASGSGTIDFQGAPTSLTASANIEVTGNVIAHQFHGDGSGLTGIPPTAITGTLSQWEGTTEIYFNGNVGIANTDPGHDLSVGSNFFVDDDGSNVLVVDGNVSATYFEGDGSKLTGLVTTLESVANIGNSTTNVIQFTNETTGFVTDANAVIGSNLTISGLTAQKVPYVDAQKVLRDSYITTSTGLTSIDSNLSVTGNMFVYGERFFIESESQLLKDPIIGLANNNVDQNIDIGILMQRPTSNVGIIHHGGTNELTLGYTQSNLVASEIINDLSQELTVNVIGNVVTQNNLSVGGTLKINTISAASSHSLSAVSNVGNTTSNTVQFTNPTTSLVASGNVEVGGNVVAGYLYGDGSNITGISSNLDQIVNIGNVTSNTVQFTNATTGIVATGNVEVGGSITGRGRFVPKTRTITHGVSGSGEVDTYTLEADENRIVLNNAQGTAASSRTYTANFTSGVPTEVGTIIYLEINSSRTASAAAGVNHKSEIQFIGTKVLSTGDNYISANGSYSKTLKRVIILTSNSWEDITEIKHGDNGRVTVDTSTFHVDTTNNRVGVGTTSPDGPLHISKSAPYNGDTGPGILFTRYANTYGGCIWNESNNSIDGLYFNAVNNVAGAGYGATPKMVINSNGRVGVGIINPRPTFEVFNSGLGTGVRNDTGKIFAVQSDSTSWTDGHVLAGINIKSAVGVNGRFLQCNTGFGSDGATGNFDAQFILYEQGTGTAENAWNGGGADYAEYFEWSDGNPDDEDRVGMTVKLNGDKIELVSETDDTNSIIGAISANPGFVGDNAGLKWKSKYLRDDFERLLMEDYEVYAWKDEKGDDQIHDVKQPIPEDLNIPEDRIVKTAQRRVLNPSFDPDVAYVPREERKEWSTVGLVGKLRIRTDQPIHSNWILLRNISDSVGEWLIK